MIIMRKEVVYLKDPTTSSLGSGWALALALVLALQADQEPGHIRKIIQRYKVGILGIRFRIKPITKG